MTSAEKWRTRVLQWKASGLTAGEYGGRHGVSKQQLHNWAFRLGLTGTGSASADRDPAAVRLVPVVRRPAREMASRPQTRFEPGGTGIRLSFAGATMDVESGFDPATLRRILQVARSMHGEQP